MSAVGAVCAAARRGDIWRSVGRDGLLGMSGPMTIAEPGVQANGNYGIALLERAPELP